VFDDFVSDLTSSVSGIATGDPLDESTAMGPVISGEQLERVRGMVDRARGVLLRAVRRGQPRPGQ
jgi:acyl-CoA reductase-like NAD-dependent aldehyde dehydrogenase